MAYSYSYFPGCTLRSQAAGFEKSTFEVCSRLGIQLRELSSWQCCGAVFPLASDYTIGYASPFRSLCRAAGEGLDLVTLCSGCYNVLKRVNGLVAADEEVRKKLVDFVDAGDYQGDKRVLHLVEVLRDELGVDELKRQVVSPLSGLNVACYYGCLLLKPPSEMQLDDPENPSVLEELLEAAGATAVKFPMRTECCGSYVSVESEGKAFLPSLKVMRSAASRGADVIAVSCPLCLYNLEAAGSEAALPVVYFTELLALALGASPASAGLSSHQVDPVPLLTRKGIVACAQAASGGGEGR